MKKNKPTEQTRTRNDLLESGELEKTITVTVMVVDDQDSIRRALAKRLEKHDLESLQAESGAEALDCLEENDVDLVLLDIGMPEMDGFETLDTLRDDFDISELPVIMLTGREDEEDVLKALEMGANDYVTKSTDFRIALARIKTQLRFKTAMDRIVEISRIDELTELLNRRAFYERLEDEHERFKRTNQPYSLVMMDIDHFKEVNDTYGHSAGDRILRGFSERLRSHTRKVDILGRFGGEEFILLLPETDHEGAQNLAEKLRETIAEAPFSLDGQTVNITASFGVTTQGSSDPLSYEELIKATDEAMYDAKADGRNCVKARTAPEA